MNANPAPGSKISGLTQMPVTPDLAERIAWLELEGHVSKTLGMQRTPGNPLGVEIARFGQAACFTIHGAPRVEMYRALNLTAADTAQVEPILRWFRSRGLRVQVDVSPHQSSPGLLAHMADLGLAQCGFLNLMVGQPAFVETAGPPELALEEYSGSQLEEFARLAVEVEQIPPEDRQKWTGVIACEYAGWRCYLARLAGYPAAHMAMRVHGGAAVMMSAETSPQFRRRGCQSALLRRAINDAAEAGCSLVTCAVYPGTISQRNVERAGLRVAYTKALWSDRFHLKGQHKEV